MTAKEIGKKITLLRKQKNLTKNALANLSGVSPTYINDIEQGRKCPTVEYLGYICQGLEISLSEFFAEEETENFSLDKLNQEQKSLLDKFLKSLK